MERAHRALLIGVGQTPATDGSLEPLDSVVEADLRLMASVLDGVGYEVEVLHDVDRGQIQRRLYQVAGDAPPGSTLLLYFTGHGVRVGGADYLVPADAEPSPEGGWEWPYLDSLLPANISQLLTKCRAGTVLWLIDACRTDLGDDELAFGNAIDNGPPNGGFAVLTACSAGEHSGYTAEGSFFTRGLADALSPLTPARTVEEVFDLARARTAAAARRHRLTQNPRIRYGTNAEAATRETEICEGRPLLETWLRAARETPLWGRVRPEDKASLQGFQEQVAAFVERCARMLHLAQGRLPRPDPWSDEAFPVRLVEKRLPLVMPGTQPLSAVEVAFLVTAPFLWEAAWADKLSQAVEVDPYRADRNPGTEAHRRHFEQVSDQHASIVRKADQCRVRGRVEDETTVVMWLVHRWIADRFETDDEPVPVSLAETFVEELGVASDRVHEVAELLCAAAAAIGLDELPNDPVPYGRVPGKVVLPSGPQPLRVRPLAALLRLAAVLSLDVRTFPEIVAEHLAVTDPVLPQHVVAVAHGLSWEKEDSALHIDAPCPHQAVHAALAEITEEADQLVARIRDRADGLPGTEADLLADIPKRVTARALRPARTSGGHEPYEVPLLRFHLAQSEVRELLMGEQLYGGQPNLALRELYQNAMDACRYRAMRWKYLTSSGARPADWRGRITFTQGEDERGRYVECRDNGVGMSAELLTHTFTRAGSRFERSKSFRREQSRWLRHDRSLRLYPNSRFGIGVFSYFMLADEMTIVTRYVSPEGIPAEHALRVDIPSSGSLFRIRRHTGPEDGLAEGGTRVRLYLRQGAAEEELSCTRVLRELVRVGEFGLEALDGEGHAHRWEPGVLQHSVVGGGHESLNAVPGVLWWVDGEGAILCDGIETDQKPFGYVLNLTGPHAGKLSVSRTELQHFDRDWAEEQWRLGTEALSRWPGLTARWTAELEKQSLRVAQVLDAEWRGKGVTVARRVGEPLSLDEVGWFHLDARTASSTNSLRSQPWRNTVLGKSRDNHLPAPPRSLVGHPVPSPGDADLAVKGFGSWHDVVTHAAEYRMPLADLLHRMRRLRIVDPSFSPPPTSGEGELARVPTEREAALARTLKGESRRAEDVPARTAREGTGIDDFGGLVLASAWLGRPLGDVTETLARLTPLHSLVVPSPPESHVKYICTEFDIQCLFVNMGNRRLRRVVGAADVMARPLPSGVSVSDVVARLSEFSWLGWVAPLPAEMAPWLELDDETLGIVRGSSSRLPDGRHRLDWEATVMAAEAFQITLADAEQRMAEVAAALGLAHEPRYADGGSEGTTVPSPDTTDFVAYLSLELGVRLEDGVDLEDLYIAGIENSVTDERVEALRAMGVRVPDDHRISVAWHTLDLRSRYVFSGRDAAQDDENFPAGALTSAVLLNAATYLQESLGDVWHLAAQRAPFLGIDVPSLPPALVDVRPSLELCNALCTFESRYSDAGTPTWTTLTPVALARYARTLALDPSTAYQHLSLFRDLGAIIPDLSAEELAAFGVGVPDEWDLLALSPEQRRFAPSSPYTPFELVSIAARLGEPVSETVRRIRPYLPLLTALASLPTAADTVPCWQDLTLLTQHFDGRLPAIEGAVTQRHITLAAETTRESEEWIRCRLHLYAGMFGLTIPDTEDQSESETRTDD
ncbi:caspase family protein [Streptomyces sp. DT2A-34]|uniref:HD domain-containing protein n=1 Tax=Streptomyces sp. DT2A-34 TaxID=3051182 RepID=UPI00265BC9BA|nr:caspase family protein [Streptomyces sp. DT2A-34]MDO0916298.1 caspase family protein [Streptomyces sp. DT2A-34]